MHIQHADGLITDSAVFQEPWVPGDFRHRDAELTLMSAQLRPVLDGDPAGDVFAWGPSGSGKTSAARYLLRALREERADLETFYLSCWSNRTRHRVLYAVLEDAGSASGVRRTAVSSSELLDRVETAIDGPAVLVLDEVDQLAETDVLYDLYHTPGLALVLVANDEEHVLARLEPRLRSRLGNATSVAFERYDVEALVSILAQRVEYGMRPDAVTREHLETIADLAAGDARDAIHILATAARIAQSRDRETLSGAVIRDATPAARADRRADRRERLGEHQRALYDVVTEAGEIAPGEAYERYASRVDEPRSRRQVREYVRKLDAYDLIEVTGENRGRRYHAIESSSDGDGP
jgi:orc1/cdc6 family replication initiation protein